MSFYLVFSSHLNFLNNGQIPLTISQTALVNDLHNFFPSTFEPCEGLSP
jgi:hypothetical protein